MKAISVYVYRSPALGDCTNCGISSRYDRIYVEHPHGWVDLDDENLPENVFKVVKRDLFGRTIYHLEPLMPVNEGCVGWMAGGNFANTSDSRFGELIGKMYGAVSIHDRQETTRQYNLLSR